MKPRIWRRDGWWYCSYYQRTRIETYRGKTPYLAWYSWKYKGVCLEHT